MGKTRTKEEINKLTAEKMGGANPAERMITDELLKMGFSYSFMGTHYLHDSIAFSVSGNSGRLENFTSVSTFCGNIGDMVCKKYKTSFQNYCSAVTNAIDSAFLGGDINYILDVLKGSCDCERMTATRKQIIMNVRQKILNEMETEQEYSVAQLRLIIQGGVNEITDYALLKSISNIVMCFSGGAGDVSPRQKT